MSDTDDRKVITFGQELDPDETEEYRKRVSAARGKSPLSQLKGNDPVGRAAKQAMPSLAAASQIPSEARMQAPPTPPEGVAPRPPGSPVIRPETKAQLEQMAVVAEKMKEDEKKAEEKKEEEDPFKNFDFGGKSEQELILNNKARRTAIESRCEPMKLEDLIINDEVTQVVPIVPGQFEPMFRSMTPDESLFVKKYLSKMDVQTDQYIMEMYGVCQLACSLVAINGKALPDHRDTNGDPNLEAFKKKLKTILKKSAYVVADLGLNFFWFDLRVRRLLNPEDLKNG